MEPTSIHIGAKSTPSARFKQAAARPNLRPDASWMEIANDYVQSLQSIKTSDRVSFFRLLATMINAGVSIVKALNILEPQTDNGHMKRIVKDLILKIESGSSFSKALETYPKYFTHAQVGMVEAGEASGQLNSTLVQIADEAEKEAAFRSRIKGAMIYPIVVIGIMIAAFIAVMVLVMPKIKDMFEGLGGELPGMTQLLINMSDFFVNKTFGLPNSLLLIVTIVALVFLFFRWKKTTWGEYMWSRIFFSMPLFGKLSKKAAIAHFCRGLSTMIASGIPIIKSLNITATSVGNVLYQKRIEQIATDVKHGITMAENMKDDEYYFPSMVVGMIGVAEQTAQIDSISEKLALYYEEEVDNMVKGLSSLMEPLIMVLLGGAVGFLVIAVMEPILSASDLAV